MLLLTTVALALPNRPMFAQPSIAEQILRAEQLREEGQPKAAIAMLELFAQPVAISWTESELGAAWNVLGSSYQDLEMFAQAKQFYGKAIEALRSVASAQAQYAAALANLGSLEGSAGQNDSAKGLYEKAARIYEGLGDSVGITITASNLAMLSYIRGDFRTARRSLATAVQAAQRTTMLKDDDLGAMYSVQSSVAFHDGRYQEAITSAQQSIDHWTHAHGPAFFMLGLGYALRAQASAKTGDYSRAITDAQHALAIFQAAKGSSSEGYWRIQMVYAQILRASGAKEEASRLKKEASTSLAHGESRQCDECTIDVRSFR
jgi:tetratricopeptide (TPR) repeat protein